MQPAGPCPLSNSTDAPSAFEKPRWLRDMLRFLPLKPQFVLSGNVRDLHLAEAAPGMVWNGKEHGP